MRASADKIHRFVPVSDSATAKVTIRIDGASAQVGKGCSVLSAVLLHRKAARMSSAANKPRAGFCLMGACQDCWLWLADGRRIRGCTTPVADGMEILSTQPEDWPYRSCEDGAIGSDG